RAHAARDHVRVRSGREPRPDVHAGRRTPGRMREAAMPGGPTMNAEFAASIIRVRRGVARVFWTQRVACGHAAVHFRTTARMARRRNGATAQRRCGTPAAPPPRRREAGSPYTWPRPEGCRALPRPTPPG